MLCLIVIAHSYAVGLERHVLPPSRKSPLSLTAAGELGGHGQWNLGQRLVRSAQNWAFCSLFTSPGSPLTQPVRHSAPCFTVAVTARHSSSLPTRRATAGHSSVFHSPDRRGRPYCFTSRCRVSDYVFKCECMCACECVCTSFHEGRSNDKMSCDQWAVDRTLLT